MKFNTQILSFTICSGLLLSSNLATFAEEAASEVVVVEVHPDTEIVDGNDTVIDDEATTDVEDNIEDELVDVDENVDGELADNGEVSDNDSEVTDADGQVTEDDGVVITLNNDWVKRGDGEEILYMSTGGLGGEAVRSNADTVEADKDVVVSTRTENAPKANTVQQNYAKPSAVKSNGRVFLLK